MSNMSYCRFQNTYGDMVECLDALTQEHDLSSEEYFAAVSLFQKFLCFCRDVDIIEDYDHKRVAEYLGELRRD